MLDEKEFDFAKNLKAIRESRGMTQRALGAAMGIDPNRISNWELGYSCPGLAVFRNMCVALNCPPGDLLGLNPAPLSGDEYSCLKMFRSLGPVRRHTVKQLLESLVQLVPSDASDD